MPLYLNRKSIALENDFLKMTILPEIGAKIASLIYKPQDFEVFSQPTKQSYALPVYGELFEKYDTSGADDMFPTIDVCGYPFSGYTGSICPDHGDLWSLRWDCRNGMCIADGRSLPYRFIRRITLNGPTVRLDYSVMNLGVSPLYGLWAFHGLTACDEDTVIDLPNVYQVLNVHSSARLGEPGTLAHFPLNRHDDLSRIQPKSAKNTEKFYVNGGVPVGEASLLLNHRRLRYTLRFPKEEVPYLGVWINEGGFKDEYNVALEPSTGFYDSLPKAKALKTLQPIAAKSHFEWYMEIDLKAE